MRFRGGVPELSGEYIAVLKTNAAPSLEVVNFGTVEGEPEKVFYTVEDDDIRVLRNVIAWSEKPDLTAYREE